jgi:Mn-dependent DtxR family transcriptional regulator
MRRLTKSRENCLRTVLALENGGEGARLTDVAEQLRVSKASACVTVSKLEKDGFLIKDAKRLISLTPEGKKEAKRVAGIFAAIRLFLTSELNVDPHTAMIDADALEHLVSEETVNAMRSFIS